MLDHKVFQDMWAKEDYLERRDVKVPWDHKDLKASPACQDLQD